MVYFCLKKYKLILTSPSTSLTFVRVGVFSGLALSDFCIRCFKLIESFCTSLILSKNERITFVFSLTCTWYFILAQLIFAVHFLFSLSSPPKCGTRRLIFSIKSPLFVDWLHVFVREIKQLKVDKQHSRPGLPRNAWVRRLKPMKISENRRENTVVILKSRLSRGAQHSRRFIRSIFLWTLRSTCSESKLLASFSTKPAFQDYYQVSKR